MPVPEAKFAVVSPQPARVLNDSPLAPRVPTLEGRTVAFLWDYIFRGDEMWEHLKPALAARHQGMKFVDHTAFGTILGEGERKRRLLAELADKLKAMGVDAVVCGVGC
jgi:hypothetical protein